MSEIIGVRRHFAQFTGKMRVMCDDLGCQKKGQWYDVPQDWFNPGKAEWFWIEKHGHTPQVMVFECCCGDLHVSGPAVARSMKLDQITYGHYDWTFFQTHWLCVRRGYQS